MKRQQIIILLIFSIIGNSMMGQNCYDKFIEEAQVEIALLNFEKAINKYKAAQICPDISSGKIKEIDQKIEDARESYINSIKKANQETQVALESAQKQARISEANRLAFFAVQAIEKNNFEEAFQIAAVAYDMVREAPTPLVEKAIGDAVYHKFSKEIADLSRPVLSIELSADQELLLLLLRNKAPLLYSMSGELLAEFSGHEGRTLHGSFSPTKNQIATAGEDGKIVLWNTNGNQIHTLHHSDEFIQSIEFSAKGELLSVARDKSMKFWSAEGELLQTFTYEDRISKASFSPDGNSILSCSTKGNTDLWDCATGKKISSFRNFGGFIRQASFSPDGSRIIIAPQNQNVSIWDSKGVHLSDLKNDSDAAAYSFVTSPDNQKLAVARLNGQIEIWDMDGKALGKTDRSVEDVELIFSPNSQQLLFLERENAFVEWDWDKGNKVLFDQHKAKINRLSYSNDGALILSGGQDNTAKLWKKDGRHVADFNQHTDAVTSAMFNPKNQMMITCGMDGKLILTPSVEAVKQKIDKDLLNELTTTQKERFGLD